MSDIRNHVFHKFSDCGNSLSRRRKILTNEKIQVQWWFSWIHTQLLSEYRCCVPMENSDETGIPRCS